MRIKERTKELIVKRTEGVVSLLLVLLLVPFYLVASILAEVGRFQSALRGYDGAISSSEISVLSNYDEYLMERFGLLGIRQDIDIESTFLKYLDKQDTQDTRSFKHSNVNVDGVYPLADTAILRQQIEEFSTYTVPTQTVLDFSDLDKIIDSFESYSTMFNNVAKLTSGLCNSAESELDSIEALGDAKDQMSVVVTSTQTYNNQYEIFESAVNSYKEHLVSERPTDEEEAAKWDEETENLKQNVKDAKELYQAAISDEIDNISSLSEKIDSVISTQKSSAESALSCLTEYTSAAVDEEKDTLDEGKTGLDSDNEKDKAKIGAINDDKAVWSDFNTVVKAAADGLEQSDTYSEALEDYDSDSSSEAITQLTNELKVLNNLDLDNFSVDDIESNMNLLNKSNLENFTSADTFDSLVSQIQGAVSDEVESSLDMDMLDALLGLISIKTSTDPYLNSVINKDYYADRGGLPSKRDRSVYSINSKYEKADEILAQNNLNKIEVDSSNGQIIDSSAILVEQLDTDVDSSVGVIGKIKSIINVVNTSVNQVSNMLTALGDVKSKIGNDMLLKGYLVYICSNRVTYESGSSLTGMEYSSSKGLAPVDEPDNAADKVLTDLNLYSIPSQLNSLWDNLNNPDDYSFCGAELEYLIAGSRSEWANQENVFGYLLMLHFITSLIPVCSDQFVQSTTNTIATALLAIPGIGTVLGSAAYVAIPLLFTLADAEIDTIFLVNGSTAPLIKTSDSINVNPTGLAEATKKLLEINTLTSEDKDAIKKAQNKAIEEGGGTVATKKSTSSTNDGKKKLFDASEYGKGLNELDYTQFVYIWMLLFCDSDTLLNRFTDIICMEQTNRRETYGIGEEFNIDNAYTTLRAEVGADFIHVLPVPTLSNNSAWSVDRILYRGY